MCDTHKVHDGRPTLHGDALKDGEHGESDIVERRNTVIGTFPVGVDENKLVALVITIATALVAFVALVSAFHILIECAREQSRPRSVIKLRCNVRWSIHDREIEIALFLAVN